MQADSCADVDAHSCSDIDNYALADRYIDHIESDGLADRYTDHVDSYGLADRYTDDVDSYSLADRCTDAYAASLVCSNRVRVWNWRAMRHGSDYNHAYSSTVCKALSGDECANFHSDADSRINVHSQVRSLCRSLVAVLSTAHLGPLWGLCSASSGAWKRIFVQIYLCSPTAEPSINPTRLPSAAPFARWVGGINVMRNLAPVG
jgi:hypothetical protein